jgi:hypothetical protein
MNNAPDDKARRAEVAIAWNAAGPGYSPRQCGRHYPSTNAWGIPAWESTVIERGCSTLSSVDA